MKLVNITAAEYRKMRQKPAKYRNVKVQYRGEVFDSKKEFERWVILKLLEKCGEIKDLKRQVPFVLVEKEKGIRKTVYYADATYYEKQSNCEWKYIVEDTKSPATRRDPVYRLKRKILRAKFGIIISEV